jgi:hypothetical protein
MWKHVISEITVIWNVTSWILVGRNQLPLKHWYVSLQNYTVSHPRMVPPKHLHLSTRLHSITSQMTILLIFIGMRSSHFILLLLLCALSPARMQRLNQSAFNFGTTSIFMVIYIYMKSYLFLTF